MTVLMRTTNWWSGGVEGYVENEEFGEAFERVRKEDKEVFYDVVAEVEMIVLMWTTLMRRGYRMILRVLSGMR